MKNQHPAVQAALNFATETSVTNKLDSSYTTSPSLARALAVGCLSNLDPSLSTINIWDPAAGSGFAGLMLTSALESMGLSVCYRGQDINEHAVATSRNQLERLVDAEISKGNTLERDVYDDFTADLVIVDAPWGLGWSAHQRVVQSRQRSGSFGFGLPQQNDSTWLFISLALEKLRPIENGGGRVAALVNPSALSAQGASALVRKNIVEAGLLESVTRLPDGLAPNTSIPLYLLTFTNNIIKSRQNKVMIADLQTQFATEHRHRSMPIQAFEELEAGLRTWKSGPRNRNVGVQQFLRRDTRLSRDSADGNPLSWRLTTFNDTAVNRQLVEARYGQCSGVRIDGDVQESFDLDPSQIFGDGSRELLKELEAMKWPSRRLSSLLARAPEAVRKPTDVVVEGQVFIPTGGLGFVSTDHSDTESGGRVLSIQLDGNLIEPSFLAAWLNTEQGSTSRIRAIDASSTGRHLKILRSDTNSLMRWADELIVPVPDSVTQLALASADERLGSFESDLRRQREEIWADPESAEEVVTRIASAFDDSLTAWLDQLPFPIASALWTAQTTVSVGEQQEAYIHAWEAIVTFHATVLLAASRSDPEGSRQIEAMIGQTLKEHNLGIERASFGTWIVIIERISKEFRSLFERDDPDEVARVRRAFGDLGRSGIERLVSKDIVKKFNEVNTKRNRWLGHTGFTPVEKRETRVVSLVSDLTDLRQLLGNVWAQLSLVRAGRGGRGHDGYIQSAEVAVGTRSPFNTQDFRVGVDMMEGELYLVRDGSQSPLPLGQFVQLRAAPSNAQYTTYFYNRTEGSNVRMVSYQYGPHSEIQDDVVGFYDAFGALLLR